VEEEITEKKRVINELKMKKRAIKTLFKRNEQRYKQYEEEIIKFPFIILSTENTTNNAVSIVD
jgi:hypothetical protein